MRWIRGNVRFNPHSWGTAIQYARETLTSLSPGRTPLSRQ
jgi:hypothetical protein